MTPSNLTRTTIMMNRSIRGSLLRNRGLSRGRGRGRGCATNTSNNTVSHTAIDQQNSTGMNSATFSKTLQFITSVKLQELEKQRQAYQAHAKVLDEAAAAGDDLIQKVEILLKAVQAWSGSGALQSTSTLGGKLNLFNLHLWLPQAKQDPSFSQDILRDWVDTLETHIRHSSMRFDGASLFGNLFNEWLASGDSSTAVVDSPRSDDEAMSISSDEFVDVGRKEKHEQMDRLKSIIFDEKSVDTEALKSYMSDLFSEELAASELRRLRDDLHIFGNFLKRQSITTADVCNAIRGLLASGLMDEGKRATLAEFLNNNVVINEVTSVLNMRMASLDTWSWPAEGLVVEMRRHLNGKYRAFTDPEIVDALLLQHIGVRWQVKLKQRFKDIFRSRAWKSAFPIKTTTENERITEQLGGLHSRGIEGRRQEQRESHFLLSQLSSSEDRPSMYDDLLDAPASSEGCGPTPAMIKQKLLQILTTECDLNKTLYGKHAVIRSDLEWFGPSLPHRSILTILEFFGVPEQWLTFFEKFLRAPLRFKQDPLGEVRIRERGTPISYALSVVCGEALLFGMDFAVNQKANGLFLYRMHDDLWLWDSSAEKCAAGWQEMKVYADLVGLKFNESKTGSVCVGTEAPPGLPSGHIRWGFLKFDQDEARFVIDQRDVNLHIVELRRQLNATKSVFGWVNAYNKYMAFFCRNFGGRSAICFGEDHTADVIKTLARIQRELFPDIEGGAVGHLQSVIERRFGIRDLPQGYFYLPISSGGLELHNPMIEAFAVDNKMPRTRTKPGFAGQVDEDAGLYQSRKESWDRKPTSSKSRGPTASGYHAFMSFYEYVSYRETRLAEWLTLYDKMLSVPLPTETMMTPAVETFLNDEDKIMLMDWYEQWVVSLYGEEVVKRFGSLEVVDPTLIPVGMVQLFRASRMKLDE